MRPEHLFDPLMQCFVESVHYDFDTRIGTAVLRDGGCTDMSGTIKTFIRLNPKVQQIRVYTDDGLDIVYRRVPAGTVQRLRESNSWGACSFGKAGEWEALDVRFARRAAAR